MVRLLKIKICKYLLKRVFEIKTEKNYKCLKKYKTLYVKQVNYLKLPINEKP